MSWITHKSLRSIVTGDHAIANNTILIQIVDRGFSFPVPFYKDKFDQIFKFEFNDVSVEGCGGISKDQAEKIGEILKDCLNKDYNVVVHCTAGICRSGAVAEVGEILGFEVLNNPKERIPNILVKSKLLKALNLSYDETPSEDIVFAGNVNCEN